MAVNRRHLALPTVMIAAAAATLSVMHSPVFAAATTAPTCNWGISGYQSAVPPDPGFTYNGSASCSAPLAHMSVAITVAQNGTVVGHAPTVSCNRCATVSTSGAQRSAIAGDRYTVTGTFVSRLRRGTWPGAAPNCTGWGTATLTCSFTSEFIYMPVASVPLPKITPPPLPPSPVVS